MVFWAASGIQDDCTSVIVSGANKLCRSDAVDEIRRGIGKGGRSWAAA